MNRVTILVVGKNDFLHTGEEWDVTTALNTEAAIEKFHQLNFDVLVFTNTTKEDELKLRKLFLFQQQEIILLQNSNTDVIAAEIKDALQKKQTANKPSFSFVDDALKAAELPITIQ
ncbi:hypothetical protein [Ferruginibacter sp.]|nr:hypothetical protein [Ferruginibacter sp.]